MPREIVKIGTPTTLAIVATLAVAALAAPLSAFAAISSVNTSCTNPGGNQAGGQQPTCTGSGQTQQSENQNPAGNAPSGQNK
jgi:hypothetical protein